MPKRTKTNRGKLAQLRSRLMNMSRVSIIVGVVVGGAAAYAVASLSFADQNPDCLNNKTAEAKYTPNTGPVSGGQTIKVSFKMPYECYTDALKTDPKTGPKYDDEYKKAKKENPNNLEKAERIAIDKTIKNSTEKQLNDVEKSASRTVTLAAYAIQDGDWRNDGANQILAESKTKEINPTKNPEGDETRSISIELAAKTCAYQIDLFRMPSAPKNPTQSSGQHNLGAIVYNNGVPCAENPTKPTPPPTCPNGVAPNPDGSCPTCKDGSPMPADRKCPGATCPSGKPMPANGKCEDGKPPVTCDNGKPVPKSGKCDVPDDDNTVTLVSADTPLGKNGPSALPDTGPGAVIATFVGVTALSSLAFEVVSSRLKI